MIPRIMLFQANEIFKQVFIPRCTYASEQLVSKTSLAEAEKIVGYPTSFLNLRWLLSDEIANVAFELRKIVGTNHPLLNTVKNLLIPNDVPPWGLIVLLISKAAGINKKVAESEQDLSSGVLHSQRALAEVTEMFRTSIKLHKALLNYDMSVVNALDLNFGNKVALLSGDYLLSNSFHILSCLKNQELNELISSALRDLVECNFLGDTDNQNFPLPSKPKNIQDAAVPVEFGIQPLNVTKEALGNAKAEWTLRNVLGGGSLLGKSCQGALMLSDCEKSQQEKAHLIGRHIALAWQASIEKNSFHFSNCGPSCLISAPVLFHLQYEPSFYNEINSGRNNVYEINYKKLYEHVVNGPGIEKTQELQKEHSEEAVRLLNGFPVERARMALKNIIEAM